VVGQRQPGRPATDDDEFSAPHHSVSAVQAEVCSNRQPVLLFWLLEH
jgi:hypothetical protein